LLEELPNVQEHLHLRARDLVLADEVLRIRLATVRCAEHLVRPIENLVATFLRHTDQLSDHFYGKLGCHVDHITHELQ
jgi:hypothetical protein